MVENLTFLRDAVGDTEAYGNETYRLGPKLEFDENVAFIVVSTGLRKTPEQAVSHITHFLNTAPKCTIVEIDITRKIDGLIIIIHAVPVAD